MGVEATVPVEEVVNVGAGVGLEYNQKLQNRFIY